jgi:hypothetical protein
VHGVHRAEAALVVLRPRRPRGLAHRLEEEQKIYRVGPNCGPTLGV